MGLGGRLSLVFASLVTVTALLIGGATYLTTDRQVVGDIDRFLRNRATEIADGQRPPPRALNEQGPRADEVTLLAVEPDAEVQILSKQGEVVSTSGLTLPIDSADQSVANRREPNYLRTVTIQGDEYRMITTHISEGGAVQVARSLSEANSLLSVLGQRLIVIAFVMAALGAGVGWLMARRTTKPLRILTDAVDAVADTQDFSVPVEAGGNDEVGRLGAGFDRMLTALRLSQEQQRRLVQDAAHELRTPLTSIKANVDWLTGARQLDEETRHETMQSVSSELNELNELIAEIIELATDQHELPPFQPVDLAEVAGAAVDRFRSRSQRTIHLQASSSTVHGDSDALMRAISNLLSNAEKYSPPTAPIIVDVAVGAIWVSDHGSGIPEGERSRVFDRFYRRESDHAQPGSGLGLAIVAGVVDGHRGHVKVGATPSGGAKIGFVLPLLDSGASG